MKQQTTGRVILFLLTAVAAALGVYLIASYHHTGQPPAVVVPTLQSATPDMPAPPSSEENQQITDSKGRLTVPLSQEQRTVQELERLRGPLYKTIRQNFTTLLSGFQPDKEDRAVLCLYLNRKSASDVDTLMAQLIKPSVADYAFTHVRFYVQDDSEGVTKWAVDSEADCGSDSVWKLVRK